MIAISIFVTISFVCGATFLYADDSGEQVVDATAPEQEMGVNEETLSTSDEQEQVDKESTEIENEQLETAQDQDVETATKQEIQPTLAANEVIVYSYAELKSAIETVNNGYTMIYLGQDITMLGGITVPSGKLTFTIDGVDPTTQVRHKFTEYNSATATYAIFVGYNGSGTITLKNMDITGKNYYGTVCVYGYTGITLSYDNVTYVGPQITYNPAGKAIYKDSTITIPNTGSYPSTTQEVGELKEVDFIGDVTINHAPSYATYIFYTAANAATKITFKADSNVNITTTRGLNDPSTATILFEEGAQVAMTQTASNVNVINATGGTYEMRSGSNLDITLAVSANWPAIWMDGTTGSFTMNGATLKIHSKASVLNYAQLKAPKMTVNDSILSFDTQGTQNISFMAVSGATTITNSQVTGTVVGNDATALNVYLFNFGTSALTASGTTFDITIPTSLYAQVLKAGVTSFTNSDVTYAVNGNISYAASSISNSFTSLSMNNSSMQGTYQVISGIALNPTATAGTSLNAINNSNLNFVTPKTAYPLIQSASITTFDTGTKLYLNSGSVTAATASPLSSAGNLTFGDSTETMIVVNSGSLNGGILIPSTGKTFTVSKPASFVVFAPTASKVVYSGYALSFSITAQQVNQWNTYNTDTTSGTLDHLPAKAFIKGDDTNDFLMQGTIAAGVSGATTVTSSNYVSGVDSLNPVGNLSFTSSNSRIMSMGRMVLDVADANQNATTIQGATEAAGVVRATYQSGGSTLTANGTADSNGSFVISTSPLDKVDFTVQGNWKYLYLTRGGEVVNTGELKFILVPTTIDFGVVSIPAIDTIFPRTETNWNIQIQDDRNATSNWQLLVQLVQPLTPSDSSKPILEDALVFVDTAGTSQSLTTTPMLVVNNVNGTQYTTVAWAANRGILLNVTPGSAYTGVDYTGKIEWILQDAP